VICTTFNITRTTFNIRRTMFNIRRVDLNLLPVFEAVYEEQNLSRAAARLSMTQSAVSHAVTRLRTLFRDELFVRQARGVLPTLIADSVYAKIRGGLTLVREAVDELQGFDPMTSARRFFVAIPHPMGPMITLRLRERLAKIAPQIDVVASTRSRPIDLDRALREGRVDAAIDWLEPRGDQFRKTVLFDDTLVAVAREGHPALRRPVTVKLLREGKFVSLRPRIEGEHPVPGIKEWRQLNLEVALEVSEILEIFMVASQSDLFGTIPRSMEKVARNLFGLRPLRNPVLGAPVPILLVWHASRDADPAHAFLRKELSAAAIGIVERG
jgi:LysR family transcriptional regulator, transcriptional activator for leuABCD operon